MSCSPPATASRPIRRGDHRHASTTPSRAAIAIRVKCRDRVSGLGDDATTSVCSCSITPRPRSRARSRARARAKEHLVAGAKRPRRRLRAHRADGTGDNTRLHQAMLAGRRPACTADPAASRRSRRTASSPPAAAASTLLRRLRWPDLPRHDARPRADRRRVARPRLLGEPCGGGGVYVRADRSCRGSSRRPVASSRARTCDAPGRRCGDSKTRTTEARRLLDDARCGRRRRALAARAVAAAAPLLARRRA